MSRKWVNRMLAAVLPWTPRSERQASVQAAQAGAAEAGAKAARARELGRDIQAKRQQVLAHNHLGDIIRGEFYRGDNGS